MSTNIVTWIPEARVIVTECFKRAEVDMQSVSSYLFELLVYRIAAWMETGAMAERNSEFWKGLLKQCADQLGEKAYKDDEGQIHEEPIYLKIPQLIGEIKNFKPLTIEKANFKPLTIEKANFKGETPVIARWFMETPEGWIGAWDKSALEYVIRYEVKK